MIHNLVAPTVGESITEVRILDWRKPAGAYVREGEVLLEIETDKATVEVVAPKSGTLQILKPKDETVPVGGLLATIDDAGKPSADDASTAAPSSKDDSANRTRDNAVITATNPAPQVSSPATGATRVSKLEYLKQVQFLSSAAAPAPAAYAAPAPAAAAPAAPVETLLPGESRKKMTRIRKRIAENLVRAQHEAALLTTFNEVDLEQVMALRAKHKDAFKAKHGVNLGYMSFFTRAVTLALAEQPLVNSSIDGDDIISRDFIHVGVAVGTDRGLVVPVLRNADKMSFGQIEKAIAELAVKARDGKLSIQDMSGGTFSISNGGVYGSMLSTPIVNPPQSAILGMHNIMKRPVVVDDKVVIRPMMYIALSYDHRLIDGKEAVTFLVSIKQKLEKPELLKLDFV